MPVKTNGILFELQPRPTKGEDGKPLLYAQPVIEHRCDLDFFDDFCAKHRHTQKGDIKFLFDVFCDAAAMLLRDGWRVETPFGTLAPKLKLVGEHTDPDKVTGHDVMYGGIEFTPSRKFVENADCSRYGFRRKRGSVGNSQIHDPKVMDEALRRSIRHGYITITMFMFSSQLKRKSAQAYLDSLCKGDNPRLRRYRSGNMLHYEVLDKTLTA